ncbi:MAG: transposase [Planctomycetota bacterium]
MNKLASERPSRSSTRLRRVRRGVTYLVTKKTNDDLFLILPSPEVNQILLYALVLRALRYGVLIHGFCFLSNHFHLVVTDLRGELPAFMGQFLTDTSKAIQVQLRARRRIWSGERYSAVELLDLDAAERKTAYTVLNPARAALTAPEDWPGVTSARWQFGDPITVKRPQEFFSQRYRPDEVTTILTPLASAFPMNAAASDEERSRANQDSNTRVAAHIARELEEIRQNLERRCQKLAGPKRVLRAGRLQRGSRPLGRLNPAFASTDRSLMAAAIAERRRFHLDHDRSRDQYVAGQRNTIFPTGTYGYRKLLGVRVRKEVTAA